MNMRWLLGAALLLLVSSGRADLVADLPARWSELQPLPEVDLSGAEPLVSQAIQQARKQLSESLGGEQPEREKLANDWGRLAALYHHSEVSFLAAAGFGNAARLEPDVMRWRYYLGWLALSDGRAQEALGHFAGAGRLDPGYSPVVLRTAQAMLSLNRLDAARTDFLRARREKGLEGAAEYGLGQIAQLRKDHAAAVEHFSKTLELDPSATRAHYPLALSLRALDRVDEAKQHLRLKGDGKPAVSDSLLDQLNRMNPGVRKVYSDAMQAVLKRDYQSAVTQFERGLLQDPDNHDARVSLARVLYLSGHPERARLELSRVLESAPEHEMALFLFALLQEAEGRPELAAHAYATIIARNPKHDGATFYLASQRFREQRYRVAADLFGKALAIDPNNSTARLLRVVADFHAGAGELQAQERLLIMRARHPEDNRARYALIRLQLLATDDAVKAPAEALEDVRELVDLQPFPQLVALLALAYGINGEFELAYEWQNQVYVNFALMAPAGIAREMQAARSAYENDRVPDARIFPADDPLLSPPPVDPTGPFRDYPAPNPF